MFGEITKVEACDDGTIKVVGVASTGAVDDADETVLPEAMKAALPAYMRFGALREMHGMTAAGATLSAQVDEAGVTRIEAHVVDPLAVKKVQLGVYKGFSIGGKVLSRDPDDRKIITKLRLNEISLVDRPCNPEAVVEMWKADLTPPSTSPSNTEVIAHAKLLAAAAGRPGRHADYVVKARQALMSVAPQAANDNDDNGFEPDADDLDDGPDAAVDGEGDDDDLSDQDRVQAIHDQMVALGAKCRADNCGHAQDQDAGGDDAGKADLSEDLAKALAENARLANALQAAAPRLDEMQATIETLAKRLEHLAAQPVPPKAFAGHVRAIAKADDADPAAEPRPTLSADELKKHLDALPEAERGRLQLLAALREPIAIPRP
jgi:hypothetical protein